MIEFDDARRGAAAMMATFTARAMLGFGEVILTMVALVVSGVLLFRATMVKQLEALGDYSSAALAANRVSAASREMMVGAYGFLATSEARHAVQVYDAAERMGNALRDVRAHLWRSGDARTAAALERSAAEFRLNFLDALDRHDERDQPVRVPKERAELMFLSEGKVLERANEFSRHLERTLAEVQREVSRRAHEVSEIIAALAATAFLAILALAASTIRRLLDMYQSEQKAKDRAREAAAARDQLLAIVAHDLRNPLAAISMKARMIEMTACDDGSRRHAASVGGIAHRAESLIRMLLDAVAVDAGGLAIRPHECPVAPLVEEVVSLFAPLAAQRGIYLETRVLGRLPRACWDRDRVQQALGNLIANALDFTPPGGRVIVPVSAHDGWVKVSVSDNGTGIPADKLGRIFDRYWHGEIAGRKGTGLGLFIAKAIVEAHGGRILAESTVGQGSTFHVELPLAMPGGARPTPC